ncbi:MAG: siphovirus ReqiPepy6 Gp37-like family protein [Pseudonocardia sp.]|nr:siphovirus ReqiPepy6 Gp37-like family protein [Pseudonocardia sp.]
MSENIPITVGVWAKRTTGWGKVSEIRTWTDLTLEPRHLQPGTWSLRMPYDSQAARLTERHLLTFDFRGTRMTGVIEKLSPQSDETGKPRLEVSGSDAMALLGDVLCWPVPSAALTAQAEAYYDAANGPGETRLREIIVANMITRRGDDVVVPASRGRGGPVGFHQRFTNLLTVVQAKAESAGLGVRMGLTNTTSSTRAAMTVEFYVPTDRSNRVRLSHKVGTLRSWKHESTVPTGTRVIVGGGGVGASRLFYLGISAAAETEWARKREMFVDARDTSDVPTLAERSTEALLEAAAQSAFELDSVEAEGMRYGIHYGLGDLVTVELLTGVSKVDRLGGVKVSASLDAGMTVQLVPGNPDAINPMFAMAATVKGIRRQVTALQRGL